MFCERCGLNFLPKQSVCTHCGMSPTRHWLQLMSLIMVLVAFACNSLLALYLLPRFSCDPRASFLFRGWAWFDVKFSLYGWVPLALGLLAWDYFVGRETKAKVKGWVTRKLLTFVLVAGIAPTIPWWVPAGQPPQGFLAAIAKHPGLPSMLAWGAVLFVIMLLCIHSQTRDSLLGHGRVLSLVGLGLLLLVLGLTLAGWTLTYQSSLALAK